jgi:hypothetical protein
MKFTQRELPVAPGAAPGPRIDEATTEFEINKARKAAADRLRSAQRVARLEESLYWLLSAATLVYLLFQIIGA